MLWLAHSSTGTGSCQKIMGVGLCTYDATEKSAIETMTTQAFWASNVGGFDLIVLKVQRTNAVLLCNLSAVPCTQFFHSFPWFAIALCSILRPVQHLQYSIFNNVPLKSLTTSINSAGGCGNQPHPLRQPKHWLRI